MNRETKFRGKGIEEYDKDKWYYGSYFKYDEINYFCLDDGSRTEEINEKLKNNIKHKIIFEMQGDLNMENHIKLADVNPETVGQYTGFHDRFGNEIYESDIVYVRSEDENAIIEWDEQTARFIIHFDGWIADFDNYYGKELEIMGDIYNNPELLGGE